MRASKTEKFVYQLVLVLQIEKETNVIKRSRMQNFLTVHCCCWRFLSIMQILQKTCVNKEVEVEVFVFIQWKVSL